MYSCLQEVGVTFDEECKVRVLDAQKFKQTEALESECSMFVQSTCTARQLTHGDTHLPSLIFPFK